MEIKNKKILHISTWDNGGGAANATKNLFYSQREMGLKTSMYVGFKSENDKNITSHHNYFSKVTRVLPLYSEIKGRPIINIFKKNRNFEFSSNPYYNLIDKKQLDYFNLFDLIHLHWISAGLISNNLISKISKPIVWTLCDMWPMTGGCHYSGDCRNYLFDCGHCPVINSKKLHDISYRNLLHRKEALIDKKIIIVGKSNWITESARKSSLFKNVRTETIGNIVDTDFFRPCNQKKVIDSRVKIGIGGLNILSLNRKNSVDLELLIKILVLNKFEVTLFGVKKNSLTLFPYLLEYSKQQKIIIQEEKFTKIEIKKIYDTFDVYIHTASQENLSNQVMEILSCGIPVIGLDVGGNSDLIISGWNGYLIKEAKIKLFIYFLNKIANERTYSFLSKNARNHIINNYSKVNIVNKYISLYQELLGV